MYLYFDGMVMIMGYNCWLLFFLLHFSIFYSIVLLCVAIKRQTTTKQVVCILGFWSENTIFHLKKCEFTIELRRVHFLWWTPNFFRFCDFSNWTGTGSNINAYFEVDLEMLLKCCENVIMRRKGDQKIKQHNDSSTWRIFICHLLASLCFCSSFLIL